MASCRIGRVSGTPIIDAPGRGWLPGGGRPGGALVLVLWLLLAPALATAAAIEVHIDGLSGELARNARHWLAYLEQVEVAASDRVQARYELNLGEQRLRQALQPFGYYRPRIRARAEPGPRGWRFHYQVAPGPPVRLRQVRIQAQGEGAAALAPLLRRLRHRLPAGTVARHDRYEAVRDALYEAAYRQGFIRARYLRHEMRVDPAAGHADLWLVLDTGPRFYFGRVSFQDGALDEALLRRFVRFHPGDPFAADQLLALHRRLEQSGYFTDVEVVPEVERARDRRVPVRVLLRPKKRHEYSASIGYGTDTGVRGRLGWEHRRVNRRGHRMAARLEASEIRQGLSLAYRVPLRRPPVEQLSFGVSGQREDTRTAASRAFSLWTDHRQARGAWRQTLRLAYRQADFDVAGERSGSHFLVPSATWERTRSDQPLVPDRALRVALHLKGAAAALLSDTDFLQAEAEARWIRALGPRFRLLARGDLGLTWVRDFRRLPPRYRFFAGGDQSIRGFGYNELGPRNAAGEVEGGRDRLVLSLELERRLAGPWRVATFFDAGNAFDGPGDGLARGAGVGVRYHLPFGMVRLDLAWALSQHGHPLRLHLTLGPDL